MFISVCCLGEAASLMINLHQTMRVDVYMYSHTRAIIAIQTYKKFGSSLVRSAFGSV